MSPEGRITATAKTDQYPAYLTGAGGENRLIVSTDDGGLASTTLTAALTPSGETIDLIPSTLNRVEIFRKRGDDLRIVWSRMDCESCNSRLFSTTTSVSSGEVRASSEAFLRLRERAHPSVAETDGTYLVTWEEEKDDRTGSRVVFIVGDGETWSLPEEAATSGSSQHEPAVAGKDGAFLLTWVEGGWGPSSSLKARVFRPGSAGQFLALGTGVSGPSVTAGPGGFLLAWNSYSAGQLRTVPVSTDGTAGAVQTPHQGLLFFPGGEPRLAPLGDGFLMTFETLVNCSRHGCTSASLLVHLDSQGAATGEPFLLTPDSQGRKAPDVATLGELSQILEWGEPSGDVTAYPTAVFTRTVAPAIGEPVLLDRMEGRPFRWVRESGAIAAAGDQFLAAWITPDSRRLMLSSIRNGLPSDPMDLGAAVEYVDIAGGEGEALIVYTAPRRDGEYGSSLQVFARRIRTGGAAGMSGDAKQKSMPAGYSRGQ